MFIVLSLLAGLLTILNPCVLPLVPVIIAGAAASNRLGPAALALGLALSFAISGTVLASAGIEFGEWWPLRATAALLLLGTGLALLVPALGARLSALAEPMAGLASRLSGRLPPGLVGQFGTGALLGLAWAPCIGPTLGAAFVLAAAEGTRLAATLSMAVFGFGAGVSLLAAGYGMRHLTGAGKSRVAGISSTSRRIFGFALSLVALLILTGGDKVIEGAIVQALPNWFVTLATRV
ncbi:sulfite exporter TauE/SafE family protein [Aquabacter sp. L1I39]|uniref:cytochrome c biogenesis CcdA family protein n=1 Tax=Aquabacter sp. L1I39 TaxID=2820278 RepID=UPI001ADD1A2F|nr:cytochrome c biogenesis protein CcdA [Aquabacter sp. L1I39]QTL03370.1 sulfite exporter TauE/SafE family protein [Aquabacter sp. L1I39]